MMDEKEKTQKSVQKYHSTNINIKTQNLQKLYARITIYIFMKAGAEVTVRDMLLYTTK